MEPEVTFTEPRHDRRPRRTSTPEIHRLWIATCLPALLVVVGVWSILGSTSALSQAASLDDDSNNAQAASTTTTSPPVAAASTTTVIAAAVSPDLAVGDSPALPLFTARSVQVVGDSLVASAADELAVGFDGATISIDAEIGRPLRIAGTALRAAAAAEPDVIVVALGTNDWDGPDDYPDQLDKAAGFLGGAHCVVWVNAQVFRPGLESVNTDIDAAARRHGWVVASWSALAGPVDLHGADGYHLSQAGQALFADLIIATVATRCS